MNEAAILLRLLRLPQVGPVRVRLIAVRLFGQGIPLQRILELSDEALAAQAGLTLDQIEALRHPATDAEADLLYCAENGIATLLASQPEYPMQVLHRLGRTAPLLLFVRGNLDLLKYPALAISGSRQAGENSLSALNALCRQAAREGWVIVSGGARGADEIAHLAAMKEGPGTIIVMPTGIQKPNFRASMSQHLEIGKTLLISEFPPECGWTPGCAMQRNRLLVALSRAVILVEPGSRGGTGGTGRAALKLGLPAFILNAGIQDNLAAAELLQQGAQLLEADAKSFTGLAEIISRAAAQSDEKEPTAQLDIALKS